MQKLSLPSLPNLTEFTLGAGMGVLFSLGLLGSAHLGAFGEGGRSEKFVAIWATRTLPVVTLTCGVCGVFVPLMFSRKDAVEAFVLELKRRDRALGLAAEQFYQESDAPIDKTMPYEYDEFFFQGPSSAIQQAQAQAVAPPRTVPASSIQTPPQGHAQGHDRVQSNPNSELYAHPYDPLA